MHTDFEITVLMHKMLQEIKYKGILMYYRTEQSVLYNKHTVTAMWAYVVKAEASKSEIMI